MHRQKRTRTPEAILLSRAVIPLCLLLPSQLGCGESHADGRAQADAGSVVFDSTDDSHVPADSALNFMDTGPDSADAGLSLPFRDLVFVNASPIRGRGFLCVLFFGSPELDTPKGAEGPFGRAGEPTEGVAIPLDEAVAGRMPASIAFALASGIVTVAAVVDSAAVSCEVQWAATARARPADWKLFPPAPSQSFTALLVRTGCPLGVSAEVCAYDAMEILYLPPVGVSKSSQTVRLAHFASAASAQNVVPWFQVYNDVPKGDLVRLSPSSLSYGTTSPPAVLPTASVLRNGTLFLKYPPGECDAGDCMFAGVDLAGPVDASARWTVGARSNWTLLMRSTATGIATTVIPIQ